jgi:hypothetical protein
VVERIHARTQGNPLYAEELLAAGAIQAEARLPSDLAEVPLSFTRPSSSPQRHCLVS